MTKPKEIPVSIMRKISGSGVFVKRFGQFGKVAMRSYAHRDDYYMVVLLTDGSASVEVDFERKELTAGDILVISPWQVHGKPSDAEWNADGWMLAFSPEKLSESEARAIEQYSISSRPFSPGGGVVNDIASLCGMLERNRDDAGVCCALASAVKRFVISALTASASEGPGRYKAITLRLRKLLDTHLALEKSPSAYASMLNISEVYLNEAVKASTGLSAGAYIRAAVIVEAKRQLAYTSLPANEIAYGLGYEDYAYFSRLFKKNVGVSPAGYRRNLK